MDQAHSLYLNYQCSPVTVTLFDGRTVGLAYYGAKTGPVVFYLHGFPGCRLSGVFFDAAAKKLGARIIALDRPGIGLSSPHPGRTALDHAEDIRQIAEQLQIESYGIIGVSGGGPYALACAYHLPAEKLKSVSILAGMGPIDIGTRGMSWSNWFVFMGFMYCPGVVRWVQRKVMKILQTLPNEKLVAMTEAQYAKPSTQWLGHNAKDVNILKNPEFLIMIFDFTREHYKQGIDGYMEEGRILTHYPGFDIQDIRSDLSIQLWYSKKDVNVPLRMGEAIAARLQCDPDLYVVDDETHLSLVLEYSLLALERLLERM